MKKNVVSCFDFTKTYAMTGWRISYLHAHKELIPQINETHILFAICVPEEMINKAFDRMEKYFSGNGFVSPEKLDQEIPA